MDAREALAQGLAAKRHDAPWEELRPFTRAYFRTLALTVERILHAAGYQIIHRDENHGPTLERAAAIVLAQPGINQIGGRWRQLIAAAIRAMGEKK